MAGSQPAGIKCVVWDLDDTLWDGVLLEGGGAELRPGAAHIVRALDERGILQSVASRNDHAAAMARLRELGVAEYFLHPQINWSAKGANVAAIARTLNLGLDSFLFVDDQPFEREEVAFACPEVRTRDAASLDGLLELPELNPEHLTPDARNRRRMYQADEGRQLAEQAFAGPPEAFLRTLGMRLALAPCGDGDLQRAAELTVRTHQLNTTGYTYGHAELDELRRSPRHLLWMAELEDRFGSYGKIGLILVEKGPVHWTIKLLLMSCRVMSRGVGTLLMGHAMEAAREAGAAMRAEFLPNGRNRMMYVTYRFAGFREVEREGERVVLEHDLARIPPVPEYVRVDASALAGAPLPAGAGGAA
jgi:FkbH-like protein